MDNSYSQQMEVTITHTHPWKDYIIAIATVGAVALGAIITNFLGPHIIKHVYEPEYITGPSGVIPIAVLKEESNVDILLSCI